MEKRPSKADLRKVKKYILEQISLDLSSNSVPVIEEVTSANIVKVIKQNKGDLCLPSLKHCQKIWEIVTQWD